MAANSIIAAVQAKFLTLGFAGRPSKLWPGIPPLLDGTTPTSLPLCAMFDDGGNLDEAFEELYYETRNLRIEVFAGSQATVDSIILGLLFNGGTPQQRLGLQYASSLPLASGWVFKEMHLTAPPMRKLHPDRGSDAGRVWQGTLRFAATAHYTG